MPQEWGLPPAVEETSGNQKQALEAAVAPHRARSCAASCSHKAGKALPVLQASEQAHTPASEWLEPRQEQQEQLDAEQQVEDTQEEQMAARGRSEAEALAPKEQTSLVPVA